MAEISAKDWENFVSGYPDLHILQTRQWGDLKSRFGWDVVRVVQNEAGAQILFKKLPFGLRIGYIPKGPVGIIGDSFWNEVDGICKRKHAVLIKMEPDEWEPESKVTVLPFSAPWYPATSIQPRRTVLVNLEEDRDGIISRMKQKTRYNIRLAERKNVIVKPWNNLSRFHEMMVITGKRDGFGVHSRQYYQTAYELFSETRACELLVAEFDGKPLAALMVFAWGKRSWYLYGASTDHERNLMPTYLLQWKAMCWAKQCGCREYDMWGVPDYDEKELEEKFETHAGALWGVYRFKRGFGGEIVRSAPSLDRVYSPIIYHIHTWWDQRSIGGD